MFKRGFSSSSVVANEVKLSVGLVLRDIFSSNHTHGVRQGDGCFISHFHGSEKRWEKPCPDMIDVIQTVDL